MEGPAYVPINGGYCAGKSDEVSECKVVGYRMGADEWGYYHSRVKGDDKTMGIVVEHPLDSPERIAAWKPPAVRGVNRFDGVAEKVAVYKEKDLYVYGGTGSYVYERMHYLAGMENIFELMYNDPDIFQEFGNKIVALNCEIIEGFALAGVDGIWGGDDWGLQDRLMISPAMWRRFFKPWYAKFFKTAKSFGLSTYMHSCGKNNEIIADLIECGLDVIELHQPNVYGVDWLAENAGGKICISTTPDIQTTLPFNDGDKIVYEVNNLKDKLGSFNGGLMYILYGSPEAINIPDRNMELYLETARRDGKYTG